MTTMLQDLRYGLRTLARSPGFAAVAIVTLALGIGANTAIFTVANALLLRPLPYRDAGRLVLVTAAVANQQDQLVPFSYPRFTLMHDTSRSFDGFAAFTYESFNLTGNGDPEQVASARVSWDFFDVLGVSPALGRMFHADEDRPGGERVAVLSHGLWMRRFGGAKNIVGRSITLDSRPYTVLGVLKPGFLFPLLGSNIEIWTPKVFELNLTTPAQVQGGAGFLQAVARLARGVSLAQADAEMEVLNKRYRNENPNRPDASSANVIDALNLQQQFVSNIRESLLILVGVVGIVLLIACANVSSLLLSRALGRRKEITIRTALGAARGTLIRQLLTESLLLASISGTVGILLGYWGTHVLSTLGRSTVSQLADVQPDIRVLAFTIAISLLSGTLFGLMPALHVSRVDLNAGLREEGHGSTGGRRRNQARNLLVVSQVTLAVILLVAAGLLIRSFLRLETANPGFEPDNILTMTVTLPPAKYGTKAQMVEFYNEVLRRTQAIAGVDSATISSALPVNPSRFAPLLAEGQPEVPIGQRPVYNIQTISPNYARVIRVPLLAGADDKISRLRQNPKMLASCACTAYNMCMQYTIRNISNTLDTVLRRWAREQGKSLNEVAIEAMARGAGLTGRTARQRDLHDIAGTWREDRAFDRARAAHEAIEVELWR